MSVLRDYAETISQPTLPLVGDAPARFDEVVAPDGSLRQAWKDVASVALTLTADELSRLGGEITRFLADDGVTYVRESGPQPWQLDPVPLILDSATWARLETGLAQRAELLQALLADVYGPRALLRDGLLPAAVVVGHSGFTRALTRPGHAAADPLLLSGADLGRDAAGDWHVLADRVQAPSGLGYAMQNRRVISQVLPGLHQEGELHRMEPYFAALHEALVSSAPEGVASPRIVVLSPGTHSETAFDQAFLANALGFPLVQGEDLVAHEGAVWMKPARWPETAPVERVDVILRRVDAEWCDPLELRADSQLGVAGLAEAVRRGTVRVVNGLGAGVLENPGLLPFLPAISERLLGEQLRLPSVPTVWGGDAASLASILNRLDDPGFIVREIDRPRKAVADLDADALRARVLAAPHRFVGQERLVLSQAPVWGAAGRVDPRAVVLRTFTLRYRSAYRPLIGGLATVREHPDDAPTTKDVWVLKGAASDPDQGIAEIAAPAVGRVTPTMPPRALQDMFWAGRYAERAEDMLRLLLTTQGRIEALGAGAENRQSVRALLRVIEELAGRRSSDIDDDFRSLLLDADRPGGVAHSLARLRDALEGVRDQLSGDTWRVFSSIDRAGRALRMSRRVHRTAESGGRMLTAVLSLHGVTANMIRDAGWHMFEAGRHLERALQVTRLVSSTIAQRRDLRADRDVLESLLTAAESVVTYRRRYRGSVRAADALELLLLDEGNPRSVAFALAELRTHLAALPASTGSTRPERLVEDIADMLAEASADDLLEPLSSLGPAIAHLHFEVGPPPRAMSALSLIEEHIG